MAEFIVTDISVFPKDCPRRRILEALKEGDKTQNELIKVVNFNTGKRYLRDILREFRRKKWILRMGTHTLAYYRITDRGLRFLQKEDISEVLGRG